MINPSVKCTDDKYLAYKWPVVCVAVILPFGIVAVYFYELLRHRKALSPSVRRPEGVTDHDLARVPRALLELALQRHNIHRRRSSLVRVPSRRGASKGAVQTFARTVLKHDEAIGVTRAELVHAFGQRKATLNSK